METWKEIWFHARAFIFKGVRLVFWHNEDFKLGFSTSEYIFTNVICRLYNKRAMMAREGFNITFLFIFQVISSILIHIKTFRYPLLCGGGGGLFIIHWKSTFTTNDDDVQNKLDGFREPRHKKQQQQTWTELIRDKWDEVTTKKPWNDRLSSLYLTDNMWCAVSLLITETSEPLWAHKLKPHRNISVKKTTLSRELVKKSSLLNISVYAYEV